MKKYLYIVAYVRDGEVDIEFRHRVVHTDSEEEAYRIGMDTLDDEIIDEDGELMNNYVIALEELV